MGLESNARQGARCGMRQRAAAHTAVYHCCIPPAPTAGAMMASISSRASSIPRLTSKNRSPWRGRAVPSRGTTPLCRALAGRGLNHSALGQVRPDNGGHRRRLPRARRGSGRSSEAFFPTGNGPPFHHPRLAGPLPLGTLLFAAFAALRCFAFSLHHLSPTVQFPTGSRPGLDGSPPATSVGRVVRLHTTNNPDSPKGCACLATHRKAHQGPQRTFLGPRVQQSRLDVLAGQWSTQSWHPTVPQPP